jgi:rod shape-determining protein MreD
MRLALLLYVAFAIQTTWLAEGFGWMGGARLDLPLIVVISSGLLCGWRTGAVTGLAAGWLCGVVTSYNLGSFMMSRLIVGGVSGAFDRRFSRDNPLAPSLCMAGGTVLAYVVFGIMSPADFTRSWLQLLGTVALNTVVGSIAHPLFARYVVPPPLSHEAIRYV